MPGSNEKLHVLRRIPEIRFDEELRGYNKHQVDRVLENLAPLADEVDVLVDRLGEAERRAAAAEARVMESGGPAPTPPAPPQPPVAPAPENFDETLSKTLLLAQRTADATVQEANDTAAQITSAAEAEAEATRQAVEREAEELRAAAAQERAAAIEQANREVAAMIEAARSTIDAKVAEAEAELAETHATTRDDLVEQISALTKTRDSLALDVEHFEGHLTSRREIVRDALSELTAVIDDPERLRTVMPPTPMADVAELPETEPPTLSVSSLDTLASEVSTDAGASEVADTTEAPVSAAPSDQLGAWTEESGTWAEEPDTWAEDDSAGHDESDPESVEPDAVSTTGAEEDQALAAGVIVDPLPDPGATTSVDQPTQAVPVVDATPTEGTSDPFLDELRRATSEEDSDDVALTKFLERAEGDEDKGGWFGRRR